MLEQLFVKGIIVDVERKKQFLDRLKPILKKLLVV